jgi:hypothetical protein
LAAGDVGLANVTNDAQLKIASNLSDLNNASTARTNLGVAIGSDVQAHDADLDSWAGVTRASGFDTFAGTPSSANLAGLVSDETGTGALVFANSPTLVTPALGTPASGVVTNLTGTASININGTVGATTPSTGAFTTLSSTTGANFATSSGLVGIGTTSPTSILDAFGGGGVTISNSGDTFLSLKTTGTTATNFIEFKDSGGASGAIWYDHTSNYLATKVNGSERMRITSAGNVGIGTAAPGSKLDVLGAFRVRDGTNTIGQFCGSSGGLVAGHIGTLTNVPLAFYTNASAPRLTIDTSGNVGIGTTTPANLLHVKSSTSSTVALFGDSAANNTLAVTRTTSSPAYLAISATSSTGNIIGGPVLRLLTAGADGSGDTERARIDASGNVGIGTASPGSKLDVNGELRIGNTVNTVTPTLPNRTITMVIGGTTYYIHAKTTND